MYYVGVDIGGTFTDCVLVDRQGNHRNARVSSTKDDLVAGVLAGPSRLAETAGVDLPTLLERTERLGHGTTIGTNAVLERRGAGGGLVATAGHGDALAMMRGAGRVAGRSIEDVFSVHGSRLPAPLIVPGAVVEVHERVDASGKVVVELDVDAAAEAIGRMIADYELDAVAVALLWSFANPAHEKALAQAIPDVFVSSSAAVSPRLGEYERTVACGGGSIAWIDEATGGLRVGPASAGSEPGPACYGRGGVDPTVTDADVVLGLLRPEAFLDGRMPLDRGAAVAAVGRLATRLGLTVEETAAGILRINNMRAATVIRQQTLERGHDPRDFVLYAFGGAGPVHAFGYAAESGVREVVIPLSNGASTLSAYGIASGGVVLHRELERSLLAPFDGPALAAAVAELRDAALADLAATGLAGDAHVEIDALMRYREQLMHSLEIPLPPPAD